MEHSLDSATRTGSNGASPITKLCEAVESTHKSVVTGAITAQCEAAGNTDQPPELLQIKDNSQVNPRPSIGPPATVQAASSTTESLGSSKVEGNSTADANAQPSLMDALGRVREDTSATPMSIDSSHMPIQENPRPSTTMGAPSKGQEAVNTLTIFTCEEKPFQSPVEVCLVNVYLVH